MASYVVSVDIGGTFTDFIVVDEDGSVAYFKDLTDPEKPDRVVISNLSRYKGSIKEVLHATTIATNALLGQEKLELPRTALITTKGFTDVIEIGRQNRPRIYDLFFKKPKPLIPRELRFGVSERTMPSGDVATPIDPGEVMDLADRLRSLDVVSVAVSLLHSYANPSNERTAGSILSKVLRYVSLSHEVANEPREYERTSTTVINAVLMPIVSSYLDRLGRSLKDLGCGSFYIMSSAGGLVDVDEACRRPIQLIESGPAAGVIAVAEFSKLIGVANSISFDMGGTTAKAGTVIDGVVEVTSEYEVGGESHHGRIVKGSGYPVRFPFVDLAEVSAGGGTVIWRDDAGALRVGPFSAGSDPGPMCYGRGGARPTITDANLLLGRIGLRLAGGFKLDRGLAERGLSMLGDPVDVAINAVDLINIEMSRAIRLVTVERGYDPGNFVLVAYGGAGPQHAVELAIELGLSRVIIPPAPGVFTSYGMLLADWRFEARESFPKDLDSSFRRLEEMLASRVGGGCYFIRYADVRYAGQGWELTVSVPRDADLDLVRRVFEEKHRAVYGFTFDSDIEVVTVRVYCVVSRVKPRLGVFYQSSGSSVSSYGSREAFIAGEWVRARLYRRDDLPTGTSIQGPAIIEEYSSTTIVPEGWVARVGGLGELDIVEVGGA